MGNHRNIPKYQFILHKIYEEKNFNKEYKPDDYIRLKSDYLRKVLTTKLNKTILKDLEQWGIIEVDHNYERGVRSKGYRLTDTFRERPAKASIMEDKLLLKKIAKHKRVEYDEANTTLENLKANLDRLLIDFPAAYEHIYSKVLDAPRPFLSFASSVSSDFLAHFRPIFYLKGVLGLWKGEMEGERKESLSYVVTFIDPFRENGLKRGENEEKNVRHLYNPFQLHKVTRARQEPFYLKFRDLLPKTKSLRTFDFDRVNTGYQFKHFNTDLLSIQCLHRRGPEEIFFIRDQVGNRVHTNITNLRGDLRNFLYLESGEQLVNLDIKTSQPTFFNTLIAEYFKGQELPADARLYQELTCHQDKDLYKYVMSQLGIPITKEARTRFKSTFFGKVFFCRLNDNYQYEEIKVFKRLFPNVYRVIEHHKREDYKQLAIQMQQRESDLIIDRVCGALFREHGAGFFCTTIHDSVLTTAGNAEIVKAKMLTTFREQYGFEPSITVEPLG